MSPAPAAPNADSIGSPSPSQGIRIEAGEAARIGATDGTLRRSTIDPAQLAAWRPRHLTFSGDPLSDIVEDFNRYNRVPRIHIRGDMLRAKRFSGGFDADDPESLIEYLRQVDGLLVEVSGDDVTISERGRRTPGDPFRSHTPPLD
jgi:ferric-dicitrate binding protein FerR (iron transport regulator)